MLLAKDVVDGKPMFELRNPKAVRHKCLGHDEYGVGICNDYK